MQAWASLLAAVLEFGLRLLEKLDAARAREFRNRAAVDGAGVLISQLNPAQSPCIANTDKPATCRTGRCARRMDE